MKTYEMWIHGKQGDDFAYILESKKGDLDKALRYWADLLIKRAAQIRSVADHLTGHDVSVEADNSFITLIPKHQRDEDALNEAAAEGLIAANDDEDEDETCVG